MSIHKQKTFLPWLGISLFSCRASPWRERATVLMVIGTSPEDGGHQSSQKFSIQLRRAVKFSFGGVMAQPSFWLVMD